MSVAEQPRPVVAAPRDLRVDALKGFAIVCVVLYHTLGQFWITAPRLALYLRELVFAFMLPLFAFLSGYVGNANRFDPKTFFTRRTLGLMVPYVCWEIVYGLAFVPAARAGVLPFGRYVLGTLADPHLEGRMWYLYVLWVAMMVLGLVRLLGRDRTWVLAASIVLVMVWPWWGQFKRLQWIYAYVVLGLFAKRYRSALEPRTGALGIAGAIAFVPLWLATRPEKIALARVQAWITAPGPESAAVATLYGLSTVTGVSAIAALWALADALPRAVLAPWAWLGRLSLGIYLTHFFIVEQFHDPAPWMIPVIVVVATGGAALVTLALARWRVTATLLLGERWVPKSLELGDVRTETL